MPCSGPLLKLSNVTQTWCACPVKGLTRIVTAVFVYAVIVVCVGLRGIGFCFFFFLTDIYIFTAVFYLKLAYQPSSGVEQRVIIMFLSWSFWDPVWKIYSTFATESLA